MDYTVVTACMCFPAFLSSWSREKAMWIDSQLLNVDHSWP